jgi:hypothetical protein
MNPFGDENPEMNLGPTARVGERQAPAAAVPVTAEILPPVSPAASSVASPRAAFIDVTESDAIDPIEEEVESHDEQEDEQEEEERMARKDPELNPNILQESMIRLLNQRVYSDDPPLEITPELVADIPHLFLHARGCRLHRGPRRKHSVDGIAGRRGRARREAKAAEAGEPRQALQAREVQRRKLRLSGPSRQTVLPLPCRDARANRRASAD